MANYSKYLRNSTIEEKIIFDYVIDTFNPSAIVPLQYIGVYAGSEFLTYAATKLYIATTFNWDKCAPVSAVPTMTFYNNLNASSAVLTGAKPYWNSTAAAAYYLSCLSEIKNIWFSRVVGVQVDYLIFKGFRITY